MAHPRISGGGGVSVAGAVTSSIASSADVTISDNGTGVYTLHQVGAIQVTVTVNSTSDVVILVCNAVYRPFNQAGEIGLGYQVDSDTAVHMHYAYINNTPASGAFFPLQFTRLITGLSVGSHTIKLMAFGAGSTWVLYGDASSFVGQNFFSATVLGGIANTGTTGTVGSWTSFTPTGSWTTNTSYTGSYRTVGKSLECRARVLCSGAPSSGALSINLPAGFTIDTTVLLGTGDTITPIIGAVSLRDEGVSIYQGCVNYHTTTAVSIEYLLVVSATLKYADITPTAPFTFGSTDYIEIAFTVPVL